MYREVILDHYRSPRGKKPVGRVDIVQNGNNPSCGDEICLKIEVEKDKVTGVNIDCQGCAISVASASMLAEYLKGKSVAEAQKLGETVRKMLRGDEIDIEVEFSEEFEDLGALQGVRQFPVRIKCALLAWIALLEGLKKYNNGKGADNSMVSTEDES